MQKFSEIKEKLQHGDHARLAKATGYSKDYVWMVLNGVRKNDKILEAASLLIANNKSFEEQIQLMMQS